MTSSLSIQFTHLQNFHEYSAEDQGMRENATMIVMVH